MRIPFFNNTYIPLLQNIMRLPLRTLRHRPQSKIDFWRPPSFEEFARAATAIYSPELVAKLKKMNAENLKALERRNIFFPEDSLHDELSHFYSAPFRTLTHQHFMHLKFLECLFEKKKLTILDVGCGSGDFTFIARYFGHTCYATEMKNPITHIDLCKNQQDLMRLARWQRRQLFNTQDSLLLIKPQHQLEMDRTQQYDAIYINYCTIHFAEDSENVGTWEDQDWRFFLTDLVKLLTPSGFIFITLADPCYDQLPECLAQFYIDYKSVFSNENQYWEPLLIIKKEKILDFLKRQPITTPPRPESKYTWGALNRETFMKDSKNSLAQLIT